MANKKINQLVSKTSILSTDLFGIGDATTGQLFKKTIAELQAAIGGAVISVNGLVGTVVLDTDDIQELATPTNKWFTDARARAAISLTVTGNSGASTYSSGTGVLNVPTYTLAGLGGITATFLSGGTGISYNSTTGVISYSGTVYTDASIRALFTGGTGITYNSTTGAITYSGTVYTDSSIRALISLTTTGNSGASTYNNTTGVINVPEYTLAGLGGISLTSLSGGTGITYNNTTGAISYSGTVYTDSSIRGLISATSPISYNSTTGVISLTSGNLTEATSSVLTITGGTGSVLGSGTSIQVKQATTSVSGFLSSTDWNTFNNKQGTITLTTTGTSGAATFSSGTLNIPNYGSAISGTNNYVAKFNSSSSIGASQIFDNGTNVGIGTSSVPIKFTIATTNNRLELDEANSTTGYLEVLNTGRTATNYLSIYNRGLNVFTRSGGSGSSYVQTLTLADTGAATFSSSVTAGDLLSTSYGTARIQVTSTTNSANAALRFTAKDSTGISKNAGIYYVAGTTTANSFISLSSDDNTYLFNVLANGNCGIGTTTPGYLLDVNGNGGNAYIRANTSGSSNYSTLLLQNGDGSWHVTNDDTGKFNIGTGNDPSDLQKFTITSAGNVGIGTSSPTWLLEVYKDTTSGSTGGYPAISLNNPNAAGFTGFYFYSGTTQKGGIEYSNSTNAFSFYSNSAERMRITSGGNILMGTTTDNGERLYVSGAIRATGTITANSDLTLKKNLLRIENALEKVEQINGYTYEFKADDYKRHAGVIAQEIQTVLPEIVNKGNDGILGVEYGNISALLIEAIKEQNIKIKNLETLLASK